MCRLSPEKTLPSAIGSWRECRLDAEEMLMVSERLWEAAEDGQTMDEERKGLTGKI